jgi:hypothetical protein
MDSVTDRASALGAVTLAASASLVPLPLLDDWLASWSRRHLVAKALARHGRTFSVRDLRALYNIGGTLWGLPWRFAKGVVLAPIKLALRVLLVWFAARDVALAVAQTLALAHILDRELRAGRFHNHDDAPTRRHDAERLRRALDSALAGIDIRLAQSVAVRLARRRFGEPAPETPSLLQDIERRVDASWLHG